MVSDCFPKGNNQGLRPCMQESNLFQLQPNLPTIDERLYYIHQQLMNVFTFFTIRVI